ncbi:MAG TPA: molybdate ABC transporter substrate-binding protein [Candidatus Limnocylindrales bacterium]|nr:molybdate ABC transporter substrate-binding protein [Candidatus Limnocylindrales bacterium]
MRRALVAVTAMLLATACSPGAGATSGAPPAALTVFAAASLKGALDEATAAYEAANRGTTITLATDSSAALETQIEQGAPADVFLSADTTSPARLVEDGFASGEPVAFAGNKLAVIVPKGNPGAVTSPFDLAKPGLKVIAAGDEVPITKYATQLVANLAADDGSPAGFEEAYARNVVSKEDNVRAIVGKIELGEGDAAIVYATDADASGGVDALDVPDGANVPATYAGVAIKASPNQAAAAAFLAWIAGPDGQEILATFGFLPPPS